MLLYNLAAQLFLISFLFYTNAGPGGAEFTAFKDKTASEHGVQFHKSLADVPPVATGVKRLALISGRTVDNPRLLGEAIAAGCSVIYLEKPGAPTVAELKTMKQQAADAGVAICMGYNKVRKEDCRCCFLFMQSTIKL